MMPEAMFVLSKSKLFDQYKKLEDMGLEISYSVKTNPIIANLLENETESSFSVHTKQELGMIKDKSRIWFLAESWDEEEIQCLTESGIKNFIVYNTNDLDKLTDYLKGKEHKINLLLRVKLRENTIFTERYFVFGMDAKTINKLIPELKGNPNIEKLGIHFHRKTQNVSEWTLRYELGNILDENSLKSIDIVNIGGGLPIKYRNTGDGALAHIFAKIKELKEWLAGYGIETMIEPGRFLSGPSIRLETHIKNITENNMTVNCSVYNSSMDTLIVPIKLLVEGELHDTENDRNNQNTQKYRIKGCTPCSMDIFRYSVTLPEMKVGDKITFLNAGAYTFHTDFCGLDKLKTKIVD